MNLGHTYKNKLGNKKLIKSQQENSQDQGKILSCRCKTHRMPKQIRREKIFPYDIILRKQYIKQRKKNTESYKTKALNHI